ncbi:MAG: MBL fold metallo-hydrolase [Acidimicrobiia bacterium]|nr:MBL fold metallo-hydrolase [Acidimicrobiia bacterium]MDH3397903.1 MBL fold metallo-hydrolase [Acidimicrobiia bacterium]MDH5616370.1 MBL fold metallo-hydrolase [Acidimicrobiia bacterium]
MRVERILAPNPGPFTGSGTNTYLIISDGEALIIDPGPLERAHEEAILTSLVDLRPKGILVTHTHEDHAPLANPLAADLDLPAYGYAPGPNFKPDLLLADEDWVWFGREQVQALHTPGHSVDHLCFLARDSLFTGDHIMGGSSVVVEDMSAYLASLRRLQQLHPARLYPGHGLVMHDPAGIVAGYIEHRLQREQQVLSAIKTGASTVMDIVQTVYEDIDSDLHPLAAMSVRAHLTKLADDGVVQHMENDVVSLVGELP